MARPRPRRSSGSDTALLVVLGLVLTIGGALPAALIALGLFAWLRQRPGQFTPRFATITFTLIGAMYIYALRDYYPDLLKDLRQVSPNATRCLTSGRRSAKHGRLHAANAVGPIAG